MSPVSSSKARHDSPVIEWRCSPHFQNTGLVSGHRFLRARPGTSNRRANSNRTAAGPLRPAGPPPRPIWAGPAGDRAALGVAAVAADHATGSRRCRCPRPRQREETFRRWSMAAGPRRAAADSAHRRGLALGGCLDPGVPGAVYCRGIARPNSHSVDLPSRISDAVAGSRSPDQPGLEPADATPGRRVDAARSRETRCPTR